MAPMNNVQLMINFCHSIMMKKGDFGINVARIEDAMMRGDIDYAQKMVDLIKRSATVNVNSLYNLRQNLVLELKDAKIGESSAIRQALDEADMIAPIVEKHESDILALAAKIPPATVSAAASIVVAA